MGMGIGLPAHTHTFTKQHRKTHPSFPPRSVNSLVFHLCIRSLFEYSRRVTSVYHQMISDSVNHKETDTHQEWSEITLLPPPPKKNKKKEKRQDKNNS
jgi:hypothetical protein